MFRSSIGMFCALTLGLAAQTVDRTKPPETPPIPGYKLPPFFESKLSNGLTVVLVEDKRFPLITVRLGFPAGSKFDPENLPGLSENVAALLTEGTPSRTSRQLAEELASIGGALSGQSDADGLILAGTALAEHTPKLLELMADVARNATFPDDEVQLHKQNRKQALQAQRAQPNFLADEKLNEMVFGSHPYAHIAPTMESLDKLDRKTLTDFQKSHLIPNTAFLVILGRLPARPEMVKLIEQQFGSWQKSNVPSPPAPQFPERKRELALVSRAGSVQADIHIGQIAATRSSPDYFPLMVGTNLLGGGTSSRMFENIREKEGFAYDAHAALQPKRDAGLFAAVTQVRNEVLEPALQAVENELKRMVKEPVTSDELSRTQNYLSGFYLLRLQTQAGLANQLISMKLAGLPNDYLEKYTARVRAVTPGQIQAAAQKYISPGNAAIVVVGDAEKIAKPLEKFGKFTVTQAK